MSALKSVSNVGLKSFVVAVGTAVVGNALVFGGTALGEDKGIGMVLHNTGEVMLDNKFIVGAAATGALIGGIQEMKHDGKIHNEQQVAHGKG